MTRPERESRPANRAAGISTAIKIADVSVAIATAIDGHSCGVLSLTELHECGRRGLFCGPDRCAREQLQGHRADTALRCAALRFRADRLIDPGGWLACQLRDFADLLEVAQREEWIA